MNIEDRIENLESANRSYYRGVVIATCLLLVAVSIAANPWGTGELLRTPVEIRSPSDSIVVRINDEGTIEFLRQGLVVAELNETQLNDYDTALLSHEAKVKKLDTAIQRSANMLNEQDKRLKVIERHILQDRIKR